MISTSSQGQDCVEWAFSPDEQFVRVRHSQRPDAQCLEFTVTEWRAFVAGVKNGEADL
jgi:hypothetical protein